MPPRSNRRASRRRSPRGPTPAWPRADPRLRGCGPARAPRGPRGKMGGDSQTRPFAAVVALAVFGITSTIVWRTFKGQTVHFSKPNTVDTLGKALFSRYVLPFEIVSVVLLAALVGAVVLAR